LFGDFMVFSFFSLVFTLALTALLSLSLSLSRSLSLALSLSRFLSLFLFQFRTTWSEGKTSSAPAKKQADEDNKRLTVEDNDKTRKF
jgi:hypothetical protein